MRKIDVVKLLTKKFKTIGLLGAGGAVGGYSVGQQDMRKESAKKGLLAGAGAGVGALLAPKIGKFVFRRIRGKIVPMRVK